MLLPIRRLRRFLPRPVFITLFALILLDAHLTIHTRPFTKLPTPDSLPAQRPGNETIFIASIHRNSGQILASSWSDSMLRLVDHLGGAHGLVHFSAVESGSQDDTKDRLTALKEQLDARGVPNTIVLGKTVQEQLDELADRPSSIGPRPAGWVWNAHESHLDMRRISYLARERNLAMEPLATLRDRDGIVFDKILWFNDVVFDTADIAALLDTRAGNYAAACAMDFTLYPYYYDTFALRDDQGLKTASWYWPWFHSARARALAAAMEPVLVQSCWNGAVAFDAAPFYAEPALRFRAVDDSLAALHLEGSECCLIHADNPLSREKGVWLNPNVRVGYNVPVYGQVKTERFPDPWAALVGSWANRYLRVRNRVQLVLERWVVEGRLRKWTEETPPGEAPRREMGEMCLINEMQIMWMNGWKHI
ncbi:Alpha-1,3-mannosyltransferase CMT1-like protein 2 [Colletotrichum chlorophyti]|uniref:Alpha-1,3-mannosyltransferase CMT1-like protein 2 n=1 Tax=Colletotrichum chlorophyti TaxID=708187 RepID=A0A1Q8R9R6_9PEZI|nr:Alpha-1,3-mannosyltransferase CMT1-like protein 2 [Colletotrichum chlorophyti]